MIAGAPPEKPEPAPPTPIRSKPSSALVFFELTARPMSTGEAPPRTKIEEYAL
jgi:hypothetical protein